MKFNRVFAVLCVVLIGFSCAEKDVSIQNEPIEIPGIEEMVSADSGFVMAESAFQENNFTDALEFYKIFVKTYPDDEKIPFAMDRLGDLYMMHGFFVEAAGSYEVVLNDYPESRQAVNSGVNYLLSFYNEGKYREVISRSGKVLALNLPDYTVGRVYEIAGDAFFALEADLDASIYYLVSYLGASDENREMLKMKLKGILVSLSNEDVKRFIKSTDGLYSFNNLLSDLELEEKDVYEFSGETYLIGCLFPQTGKYSLYGRKAAQSIEFALYRYNLNNNGPEIKIIFEDTGSDSITAIKAVRKLAEKGVAAIIGPIGTVEPVVEEAQVLEIPIIAISGRENIPDIGSYVFRNGMTKKIQAKALCRYAVESAGVSNFAILYPDKPYGQDYMNLFWDEVESYGGRVVGVESYDPGANDFEEPVKKLAGLYYDIPDYVKELEEAEALIEQIAARGNEPDKTLVAADSKDGKDEGKPEAIIDFEAVFIPDQPAKIGLILPQLKYYDIEKVLLLGTNLWHSDTLIDLARKDAQDAVITDGFFPESTNENVKSFVHEFNQVYGEKPGYIEAVVYDSVNLMLKVFSEYMVYSREDVRDALLDIRDFPGVSGLTTILENGDVDKEIFYLKVFRKRFQEVKAKKMY